MLLEEIKNIKSSRKDLRNFGVLVGMIALVFGLFFLLKNEDNATVFIVLGGLLILSGLLIPAVLKPFQKVWMVLGSILGWIVTNVILTIFFFTFLLITAFIARLFKKRFLDTTFRTKEKTYWKYREEKEISKTSLEKQF